MNEEIVRFDIAARMMGILSTGGETASAPVVLMLNAGLLHHVGPFRLWVDLARELARTGVPSLRFDLCGLGDSGPTDISENDTSQNAVHGLVAAMDFVEARLGKRGFIAIGLCSGADWTHSAAKADSRIRGAVFLNGYGYRTFRFHLNRQLRRVFSYRRCRNFLRRLFGNKASQSISNDKIDDRDFPELQEAQNDILRFLSEGRRLCFIYTNGVPDYYNYSNQFWDMFPRLKPHPALDYQYFPETDHTFTLVQERHKLVQRLVQFATAESSPIHVKLS